MCCAAGGSKILEMVTELGHSAVTVNEGAPADFTKMAAMVMPDNGWRKHA
jgi:hypothetical protein